MATKLDQMIATVAIEAAGPDPDKMIAAASEIAPKVTPADAAKLPKRWYPKVSSTSAGAPQFRNSWPRAWFEALVEVLCQKGAAGLPSLYELLERDGATYHEMVVIRLLRMAAKGLERDAILSRIEARLPALHETDVLACVRETVFWSEREPRVLDVLRPMAKVKVKNGEGTTVGDYIKQYEEELRLLQAKRAPRKSADPFDECVVATAVLALDPNAFRAQAAAAARKHGSSAVDLSTFKGFAERFAAAVVAKDFAAAQSMLCTPLRKEFSAKKLATLIGKASKHSGPPDAFEYSDNDTTAKDLRDGGHEFSPLPAHVADANFRRWCCLQFLPGEESETDACFDWWMALVEEKGELRIGFFQILDAD